MNRYRTVASFISLLLVAGTMLPSTAQALSWSGFLAQISDKIKKSVDITPENVQTMPVAQAATNIDPNPAKGGGDITIVDDSALLPEEGPSGTLADIEKPKNATISTYVVRPGDTLSDIAELFEVSINTIIWANDLKRGAPLKVGEKLTILPISGVNYTVKKGDTLASIAKKYHGHEDEIAQYNGIDAGSLVVGSQILIPNGEISVSVAATPKTSKSSGGAAVSVSNSASYIGYYMRPISGDVRSQGIHGYNGVDLAAPLGTPIVASAAGEVIVSKQGGWNGGYGNYIVIRHDNGTQTLYSHNSSNAVGAGETVVQGQVIGYVGSTGRSTGAHVHFEIRGGIRNPF